MNNRSEPKRERTREEPTEKFARRVSNNPVPVGELLPRRRAFPDEILGVGGERGEQTTMDRGTASCACRARAEKFAARRRRRPESARETAAAEEAFRHRNNVAGAYRRGGNRWSFHPSPMRRPRPLAVYAERAARSL